MGSVLSVVPRGPELCMLQAPGPFHGMVELCRRVPVCVYSSRYALQESKATAELIYF